MTACNRGMVGVLVAAALGAAAPAGTTAEAGHRRRHLRRPRRAAAVGDAGADGAVPARPRGGQSRFPPTTASARGSTSPSAGLPRAPRSWRRLGPLPQLHPGGQSSPTAPSSAPAPTACRTCTASARTPGWPPIRRPRDRHPQPDPLLRRRAAAPISDEEILSRADPDDADGDGISGRPNYDRGFVGRFGRKAQTVSIEGVHPRPAVQPPGHHHRIRCPTSAARAAGAERGPITASRLARVACRAPASALVRPRRRRPTRRPTTTTASPTRSCPRTTCSTWSPSPCCSRARSPTRRRRDATPGAPRFEAAAAPAATPRAARARAGRSRPTRDLLLHDMGPDLADGITMGDAIGSEFRTQPLWGVVAVGPYLHDGRADTLDEAIRMHGGEAEPPRATPTSRSRRRSRAEVIAFLESLGGRSQDSSGLLPPDAPISGGRRLRRAVVGLLSAAELTRFAAGRLVFDRDFGVAAGVGAAFNGDSCRACHFDPVIGGAGPARRQRHPPRHRRRRRRASPRRPSAPSLTARPSRLDGRPRARTRRQRLRDAPDAAALRARPDRRASPTPTILARADPDDADGDGISGRPNILPDGRLGRLGWKANVPSLAEFVRDAPDQRDGHDPAAAGRADLRRAQRRRRRSPDPRFETQPESTTWCFLAVARAAAAQPDAARDPRTPGEALFAAVGCATCHVPELHTADGTPVPLYSDLLLHDVRCPTRYGIADGAAQHARDPHRAAVGPGPLAPYLHDGAAATVEEAIAPTAARRRPCARPTSTCRARSRTCCSSSSPRCEAAGRAAARRRRPGRLRRRRCAGHGRARGQRRNRPRGERRGGAHRRRAAPRPARPRPARRGRGPAHRDARHPRHLHRQRRRQLRHRRRLRRSGGRGARGRARHPGRRRHRPLSGRRALGARGLRRRRGAGGRRRPT